MLKPIFNLVQENYLTNPKKILKLTFSHINKIISLFKQKPKLIKVETHKSQNS